ncbi:hypothetical protein RUM43_012335 [Polyplax serrata]|uniref:Uncharacterized protein n=1 Tax=Polyplax serrata TaxID=468196 RepID=A0AAN8P3J6_POLSC
MSQPSPVFNIEENKGSGPEKSVIPPIAIAHPYLLGQQNWTVFAQVQDESFSCVQITFRGRV